MESFQKFELDFYLDKDYTKCEDIKTIETMQEKRIDEFVSEISKIISLRSKIENKDEFSDFSDEVLNDLVFILSSPKSINSKT